MNDKYLAPIRYRSVYHPDSVSGRGKIEITKWTKLKDSTLSMTETFTNPYHSPITLAYPIYVESGLTKGYVQDQGSGKCSAWWTSKKPTFAEVRNVLGKVPENKVRYRCMMSMTNDPAKPIEVHINKYTKADGPGSNRSDEYVHMECRADVVLLGRSQYVFSELPSGCMQNEGERYAAWWTAHKPTRQEVIEQFSEYALSECREAIEKELGRLKSLFDANAHPRRREFRKKLLDTWDKLLIKGI